MVKVREREKKRDGDRNLWNMYIYLSANWIFWKSVSGFFSFSLNLKEIWKKERRKNRSKRASWNRIGSNWRDLIFVYYSTSVCMCICLYGPFNINIARKKINNQTWS